MLRSHFLVVISLIVLSACGGGGGDGSPRPDTAFRVGTGAADVQIQIVDVTAVPIPSATVRVSPRAGARREETTDAEGMVAFQDLPVGDTPVAVRVAGFDPYEGSFWVEPGGVVVLTLEAVDAWTVGRAIVVGSQVVDRAGDGTWLTFSVDMAVVDANAEPLSGLTGADFSLVTYDCGWLGPRSCASDAAGNATGGGGGYRIESGAQAFALQPPAARDPYLVGVVAERSVEVGWAERGPALKTFLSMLGGNDLVSLMTVQDENGQSTLASLGPFTSDGTIYLHAVDGFAATGDAPQMPASLSAAIERTAGEAGFGLPGTVRHVLVVSRSWLTVAEIDAISALARSRGVRVSSVVGWDWGLPEIAVRTGGFVSEISDPRQFGMVFGAMDQLLAGTLPRYRMRFRLGGSAGTFVAGGNVKVSLVVNVPSVIPNRGVYADFDVAIP